MNSRRQELYTQRTMETHSNTPKPVESIRSKDVDGWGGKGSWRRYERVDNDLFRQNFDLIDFNKKPQKNNDSKKTNKTGKSKKTVNTG